MRLKARTKLHWRFPVSVAYTIFPRVKYDKYFFLFFIIKSFKVPNMYVSYSIRHKYYRSKNTPCRFRKAFRLKNKPPVCRNADI